MSKTQNIAHNLLARLGNAGAQIDFSDRSIHSLECLFRQAKEYNLTEIELEIISRQSSLKNSIDLDKIIDDLNVQLQSQLEKHNIKASVLSCQLRLKFDLTQAPLLP